MIRCIECQKGLMRYHKGLMVCDVCGWTRGLNELEQYVVGFLKKLGGTQEER